MAPSRTNHISQKNEVETAIPPPSDGGPGEPEREDRKRDDEAGERTGGADVEERVPRADAAAHRDDGAHRPERAEKWHRQKVRQGRVHAVEPRGNVVAELVHEEDRE